MSISELLIKEVRKDLNLVFGPAQTFYLRRLSGSDGALLFPGDPDTFEWIYPDWRFWE